MFTKFVACELKPGNRICLRGPQNALRIETVLRTEMTDCMEILVTTDCGGFVAVATREIECRTLLAWGDEVEVEVID
jgi:hypothetical protein